ncbi:MAG: hypothetical protein J0M10_14130 [Chitinophagales bacterium]|jgi:hypothetical protein|nr:hypothetical protein [Chitinophagales bacterium]
MKIFITILGILNGVYMLADGIYVTLKGKYIGPEKPGPWAALFYKLNADVFKLGWLFIIFGLAWLFWLYCLWTNKEEAYIYGIFLAVLTLWYFPFGTLSSLLLLAILLFFREKAGC